MRPGRGSASRNGMARSAQAAGEIAAAARRTLGGADDDWLVELGKLHRFRVRQARARGSAALRTADDAVTSWFRRAQEALWWTVLLLSLLAAIISTGTFLPHPRGPDTELSTALAMAPGLLVCAAALHLVASLGMPRGPRDRTMASFVIGPFASVLVILAGLRALWRWEEVQALGGVPGMLLWGIAGVVLFASSGLLAVRGRRQTRTAGWVENVRVSHTWERRLARRIPRRAPPEVTQRWERELAQLAGTVPQQVLQEAARVGPWRCALDGAFAADVPW